MKVLVHDNVTSDHHSRTEYITEQIEEQLSRFESNVHQVELSLATEGHNSATVTHCHVSASLGPLGAVAADDRSADEHTAINGALGKLCRGITKRVEKRQTLDQQSVTAESA
jgi:ribosomal subunit interface protein